MTQVPLSRPMMVGALVTIGEVGYALSLNMMHFFYWPDNLGRDEKLLELQDLDFVLF
jgi:hypothetical protein